MRIYSLLFTILLFSFIGHTATFTWNGSFGNWQQPGGWDLGQVPGPNDDVIIPSGFVTISGNTTAEARTITVGSGSVLRVNADAALSMTDEVDVVALTNRGFVFIFGTLDMEDIVGTSNLAQHRGVVNKGLFQVFNGGEIIVENVSNKAIYNEPGGFFINSGTISMSLQSTPWTEGIYNRGRFENELTGVIRIKGGFYGIANASSATHFFNKGKIMVGSTAGYGFNNHSFAKNFNTGSITMHRSPISNSGGLLRNEGSIYISAVSNYAGLINIDRFENTGGIILDNDGAIGLYNYSPDPSRLPVFINENWLAIRGDNIASIQNDHSFINTDNGLVEADGALAGDGLYVNDGVLTIATHISHDPFLENNGIVEDRHGKLQGNTINNQVIAQPIAGPLVAGQFVIPGLGLGSFSNVNMGDWVDDLGGDVCGSYFAPFNLFNPNQFAQNDGDDFIWVHMEIASSGRSDWFRIKVLDGTNLQAEPVSAGLIRPQEEVRETNKLSPDISIYPNPAIDFIRVELPEGSDDAPFDIHLLDGNARLLQTTKASEGRSTIDLNLPASLPDGIYSIRVQQGDRLPVTKKVVLSRK